MVYSDITPEVKWMGPNGTLPIGDADMIVGDPVVMENKTVLLALRFSNLRTSQAGQYTCQSEVFDPFSLETGTQLVSIQGMIVVHVHKESVSYCHYTPYSARMSPESTNKLIDFIWRFNTTLVHGFCFLSCFL